MRCLNEGCGRSFGLCSRKKRTCDDCGIELCKVCIVKTPPTANRSYKSKLCPRCNSLAIVPLMDKAALQRATEVILKLYLDAFGVSTSQCVNKVDIIRLVVRTRNAAEAAMSCSPADIFQTTSVTPTVPHLEEAEASVETDQDADADVSTDMDHANACGLGIHASSATSINGETAAVSVGSVTDESNAIDAQNDSPTSEVPPMPDNLDGTFAEQLLRIIMNAVSTEQAPRQTDEEYQREQAEQRAKYKKMVAHRENANKLNTAKSVDEFKLMRVGQLKDILSANMVDYQYCLEKSELLDKVEALWKERQEADDDTQINDALCCICYDKAINSVFLECGHFCTCVDCGKQLNECPVCRETITRCVHVFR